MDGLALTRKGRQQLRIRYATESTPKSSKLSRLKVAPAPTGSGAA
jgi:hypothetical protein